MIVPSMLSLYGCSLDLMQVTEETDRLVYVVVEHMDVLTREDIEELARNMSLMPLEVLIRFSHRLTNETARWADQTFLKMKTYTCGHADVHWMSNVLFSVFVASQMPIQAWAQMRLRTLSQRLAQQPVFVQAIKRLHENKTRAVQARA